MATVTFVHSDGSTHRVQAPLDRTLMQLALDHSVPGILGDCGGACSCATCHAYVDPPWFDRLPPMGESERFMLEAALDPRANSRLCCQIKMCAELDGIVIRLPVDQA